MPRILLTGVAGFIASKVAEFLLAEGYSPSTGLRTSVVGVDNLNDAYDVRLKHWRLDRIKNHPNFHFHQLDICDKEGMRNLFLAHTVSSDQSPVTSTGNWQPATGNCPFSAVINLAARAGVRQSLANPWVYYETNVTGTLNLLELCREFGVNKFILASTSSLYGNVPTSEQSSVPTVQPFREDMDTSRPLSPYAASKKAAEALCYTYYYLYGLDVTVLRYFTVYGPAGRPDMSLFRFVQWVHEGRPVIIYGDGRQSRDFTYVDDIARGTIAALHNTQSSIVNSQFEIINLGSDRPVVLMDALRLVEELVGKKANVEYRPRHAADVLATWADIGKAKRLLGWAPQTRLEEGLQRLTAWYRENREWASQISTE